jgi:CMP-N-acetylneuraminate monooxygenase
MPNIKLHSHACLEIIHNEFSLLLDPWIDGPAFLGSWVQFPPTKITSEDLSPDAILISHEHSDHFHIPTLKNLDKNIPVYFPAFPNKRIDKTLKMLGFKHIIPMMFGITYTIGIGSDIKITCYEPHSVWNDSILHLEIGDFSILNTNDAGINHNIKKHIPKIDLLCQQFSPGASGYPLCWENISKESSKKIYNNFKNGIISMLEYCCKFYDVDFVLPFASYFRLHHPDHQHYDQAILRNSIIDISDRLSTSFKVIDLLPGESWNNITNKFLRIYNKKERLELCNRVKIDFNELEFNKHYPFGMTISKEELKNYLLNLQHVPEIQHCEDIQVKINDLYFNIQNNIISIGRYKSEDDLTIKIPIEILSYVVKEDISWDEAHIGYWCKFSRKGSYNQNFWRLLQSPYYKKNIKLKNSQSNNTVVNLESNVAEIISAHPESERVFRRYGLYCSVCPSAFKESISQAGNRHGLSSLSLSRLLLDINRII